MEEFIYDPVLKRQTNLGVVFKTVQSLAILIVHV